MADTVRTLDYFNNLSTGVFKDNTTGDIDEQDLRDFLVTALMITSAQSVTTTDVAAAIGTHYELDLSGLTANRNFLLPVAAVGDRIRVKLTTGDADHELIIKGAATVTINGGAASTEWTRLFIDDEVVEFRATSATNWDVVHDGRIPCSYKATMSTDITTNASGVSILLTTDIDEINVGDCFDNSAYKFTARRAGRWDFYTVAKSLNTIGSGILHGANLRLNDTSLTNSTKYSITPGSTNWYTADCSSCFDIDTGDYIEHKIFWNEADIGVDAKHSSSNFPLSYAVGTEIL